MVRFDKTFIPNLWIIEDLLSEDECSSLIHRMEVKNKWESMCKLSADYLYNIVINDVWDTQIYSRIENMLPDDKGITYIDNQFIITKFPRGSYIDKHNNGTYENKERNMSIMTLNIYLNEIEFGGSSIFYCPKTNKKLEIIPKKGRAILFSNDILHEEDKVFQGTKYILGANIMANKIL